MTSISSASYPNSPLDRLQSELSSEVAAGTISSSDQSALSSALKDIDSTLKSQASSGGSPPSPSELKAKINDLITSEVNSGKLTSAQASELQNVFSKAFANGGPGGPGGGSGGPGGADGQNGSTALQLLQSASSSGSSSASGSSSSTSSTSSTTNSDTSQLLTDFLKLLQDSKNSTSNYGSDGQSASTSVSLLLSYQS